MKKFYYNAVDWFRNVGDDISYFFIKLKDYDRLESDYCDVVAHATMGTMSYSTYEVGEVKNMIDQKQEDAFNSIVSSDVADMIEGCSDLEELKVSLTDYFNITDEEFKQAKERAKCEN